MKLVMIWADSDGCTYSCEVVQPFEYESIDKAQFDFLELCEKNIDSNKSFQFAGHEFNAYQHYITEYIEPKHKRKSKEPVMSARKYCEPEMYTLEDWFESYKGKGAP